MYKISFTVLIQIFLVLTLLKPSHSANDGSRISQTVMQT